MLFTDFENKNKTKNDKTKIYISYFKYMCVELHGLTLYGNIDKFFLL